MNDEHKQQALRILIDGVSAYTSLLLDAAVAEDTESWRALRSDAIAMLRPLGLLATSQLLETQEAQEMCTLLLASVSLVATSRDAQALADVRLAGPEDFDALMQALAPLATA